MKHGKGKKKNPVPAEVEAYLKRHVLPKEGRITQLNDDEGTAYLVMSAKTYFDAIENEGVRTVQAICSGGKK